MSDGLNIRQVCEVTGWERSQLNQLIVREHFVPAMTPYAGKPRVFSITETIQLRVMRLLTKLGFSSADAARESAFLRGFKDGDAVLVLWTGPGELIPSAPRGTDGHEQARHPEHGFTVIPPDGHRSGDSIWSEIVKPEALPAMLADPDKHVLVSINLNHIERRIEQVLGAE